MSKENINLPKTKFSMKANLPAKEPEMVQHWEKIGLYKQLRESRKGKEKFVLHDGPPYANGNIHMGTAYKKILKDLKDEKYSLNKLNKVVKQIDQISVSRLYDFIDASIETEIIGDDKLDITFVVKESE